MNVEQLRLLCLSLPQSTEGMPFGEDYLVYKVAGKVFAILPLTAAVHSLSVKTEPDYSLELRDRYEAIVPGYHLNKRHWNTLYTEQLPPALIEHLLRHSWNQVVGKLSGKLRETLALELLPE